MGVCHECVSWVCFMGVFHECVSWVCVQCVKVCVSCVCVSRAWLSAPAVGTSQGPFNQHRKKSWVQSLFGEYSMSIIHFSSGMIGASTHAAQHATSPKRQILPRQVEARTRCTSTHTTLAKMLGPIHCCQTNRQTKCSCHCQGQFTQVLVLSFHPSV